MWQNWIIGLLGTWMIVASLDEKLTSYYEILGAIRFGVFARIWCGGKSISNSPASRPVAPPPASVPLLR